MKQIIKFKRNWYLISNIRIEHKILLIIEMIIPNTFKDKMIKMF